MFSFEVPTVDLRKNLFMEINNKNTSEFLHGVFEWEEKSQCPELIKSLLSKETFRNKSFYEGFL